MSTVGSERYQYLYFNYSLGWVIEKISTGSERCTSWLLIPAINLWPVWLRGLLYFIALLYLFLGIAIASDTFMASIERITSKKRSITVVDEETGELNVVEIYIWNETVANLTLMALGSSISEILLSTLESIFALDNINKGIKSESLGMFTIIGSAAFNLLCISGICVISVASPSVKKVKLFGVFIITSLSSIWAYVWMLIVTVYISPQEVEPWEAWLTILMFPGMVLIAHCQDRHWWIQRCFKSPKVSDNKMKLESICKVNGQSASSIKDVEINNNGEIPKNNNISRTGSIISRIMGLSEDGDKEYPLRRIALRQKFRHLAITQMLGRNVKSRRPRINSMRTFSVASIASYSGGDHKDINGKFGFKSPKYSVMENDGKVTIDVIFYRKYPLPKNLLDRTMISKPILSDEMCLRGRAEVDYETCEGSAKEDVDYKYSSGTLIFEDGVCLQALSVPIVDDYQFENDKEFFVLLKRPRGAGFGITEPSVTKVTIVDDDDPGEFAFESGHFHCSTPGQLSILIVRKNGCDGTITMELNTKDGTAVGGLEITPGIDYVSLFNEPVNFQHGEMEKSITIETNHSAEKGKVFNIHLCKLSQGCREGEFMSAQCIIGEIDENIKMLETLDDFGEDIEEELSWPDQFRYAMKVDELTDSEGEIIKGSFLVYFLHFCSFFWRFIVAVVPPKKYLGAYPTFVCSLILLGIMTALIQQLGNQFGCAVGLSTAVTGITIVALGTSLPDTFASRTAALHDSTADNSIGNVTGSNSVNVFLGLGIPWVISSMYALLQKKKFCVSTNNLFQSVIVYLTTAATSIVILMIRRVVCKGELGGSRIGKWLSGVVLISLWLTYVILTSLKSYNILKWDFQIENSTCN